MAKTPGELREMFPCIAAPAAFVAGLARWDDRMDELDAVGWFDGHASPGGSWVGAREPVREPVNSTADGEGVTLTAVDEVRLAEALAAEAEDPVGVVEPLPKW